MGGYIARTGEMRNAYNILVGKPEWKRPLGRPRRRWEDNIRMDLREVVWKDVEWMHLAENRGQWQVVMNTVMNIWLHKSGEFLD
jgi:hypothetical protein